MEMYLKISVFKDRIKIKYCNGEAKIWWDWCPYKKRDTKGVSEYMEKRPYEDTERGSLLSAKEGRPQEKPNLSTPSPLTSNL